MALALFDRVQETTTTTGTGSVTLGGAVPGFQSFAVVGNGNTCYYTIVDGTAWEVGIGTYSTSGPTLARTTVLSNSSGNTSPITLAAGTKTIFLTYPAEKSVNLDASGNVSPLGTVSSGVWQGSTVGVAYGGTGVTTSSGANSVMLRDANQNVSINRLNQSSTTIAAAGTTTTLTAASTFSQILVGTGGQTFKLPDATTLTNTTTFEFNNNATGTLTITDNANATVGTISSGGAAAIALLANGTVGGTWDVHAYIPENVTWGTNSLVLGSTVITGGTWNGGTIQPAYGGTGLTSYTSGGAVYANSSSTLTSGTLPLTAGGTAATTAAGARTSLDVPSTSGSGATGTWGINISGNAATATNSTTTSQTNFSNLTIGGSQVLYAGNYSSYALPLSGGTLTGLLTVNSGSSIQAATNLGIYAGSAYYIRLGTPASLSAGMYIPSNGNVNIGVETDQGYKLYVYGTLNTLGAITQNGSQVLTAANYNSYAPTLTGTGATGTWAINISGTATSETLATVTARGATTSTALSLNGQVGIGFSVGRPASLNGTNWAARIGANDVYLVMNSLDNTASYASAIQSMRTSDAASFPLHLNPNGGNVTINQNTAMGYSLGVNGIIYSNTSSRAPIFYDSNDTTYYVDPASTSNLYTGIFNSGATFYSDGSSRAMYIRGSGNIIQFCDADGTFRWENVGRNGTYYIYKGYGTGSGYKFQVNDDGSIGINNGSATTVNGGLTTTGVITVSGSRPITLDSGATYIKGDTGGWATGYYFKGSSGTDRGGYGALGSADGLSYFWTGPAYNNYYSRTDGDQLYHIASVRAPIFYDSDNTGYYLNPASTSNLNSSTSNTVYAGYFCGLSSNGYGWYKGYDNNNHFITVRGAVSGTSTSLTITGAHQTTFVEYLSPANSSTGWFFKDSYNGGAIDYSIVARISKTDSYFVGDLYGGNSVRAPIFYDSDDTAYYVNPNSGSLLSTVTINNYLNVTTARAANEHGYAANFVSTQSAASNYVPFNFTSTLGNHSWGQIARFRIDGAGQDRPSIQFSSGSSDNRWAVGYCYFDDNFRITQNMGMRNDGGNDGWGTERVKIDTSGNVQLNVSTRSPIYYDLDNTGYYGDFAGTSSFNGLSVSTINSRGTGNLMYYQGFTLDANTMDTNATGFTYAVNAPAVGPVARFSTGGGYDMWLNAAYSGGGNTLYFRTRNGDAGSINSWRALASYGINYGDTLYATVFYDANDTGYYCNPNGKSYFQSLNINGASWISFNNEEGSWGIKTRTTDSTTWLGANLKNQIFCGGGANEGLCITGVGTGGAAMEINNAGNVWVKADIRVPIYYDLNDTAFYCDPNATSRFNALNVVNNITVSSGNTTGNGIILADDGDIVDLNDGYCSMRFSYGVRVFSANRGGSAQVALTYQGNVIAAGNVTAYGSPSDRRLKENIQPLTGALDKVMQLQGCTFDWKEDSEQHTMVGMREDIGFIADDVQAIIPKMVREGADGYLSLRDRGFSALLVEAMKEQQAQIESLRAELNALRAH